MLRQLWVTGILSAFLVFGIKIGLGLGAQLGSKNIPWLKKIIFITSTLLIYLILFTGIYFIITGLNLFEYLDQITGFIKYGLIVHFAVAAGLFFWGVQLLCRLNTENKNFPLKASLLLIIPCPVCITVVLLNLTLAFSLFSMSPCLTTFVLFSLFAGIIMITSIVIFIFKGKIHSFDNFLGIAMVMVSLYFIFTIIIAPVYPEIKAAFEMAVSNNPFKEIDIIPSSILAGTVFIFTGLSFLKTFFMQERKK